MTNNSTHAHCPLPNPDWPTEFPKESQTAALFLGIAWNVYLVISIVALYSRRKYQPLRSRRLGLVTATAVLGGCLGFVAVVLREYMGRNLFPCNVYLYSTVLLIPAIICPFIVRLLHHHGRVEWQLKFISMPLGQRTDVQQADLLASKYRASARRAYLAFFVIFFCFVLIALIYQQTQERYREVGCVGCEMTLGDTILIVIMFFALFIMVMMGIRRLRKKSAGGLAKTKHSEVHDIEKALLGFAFWAILWAVMRTVDPGNLDQDGTFASGYWLVFAMANCLIQMIWIPVYQTFHNKQGSGKDVTLKEVLSDPTLSQAFEAFLMREFAAENYRFLFEVRRWVRSKPAEDSGMAMVAWKDVADDIYTTFVADDSLLWVNISAPTKQRLQDIFESQRASTAGNNVMDVEASLLSEEVFNVSVKEIETLLEHDSFLRFMSSPEFKEVTSKPGTGKGSSKSGSAVGSMRPGMKHMNSSGLSSYSSVKADSSKGFAARNKIVFVDEENEEDLSSASDNPEFGAEKERFW